MPELEGTTGTKTIWRSGPVVAIAVAAAVVSFLPGTRTAAPAPVPVPHTFGISDDVHTTFGIVAVEFVRSVDASTHRAMPAASQGASPTSTAGQHIQVAVAMTNQTRRPLSYSVRQFALHVTTSGKTSVVAATSADLPDGRILPDAGIEGHLDFTVPAAKSPMSLSFRDPGASAPVVIHLGNVAGTVVPGH